jgi:glutaredoxin 3
MDRCERHDLATGPDGRCVLCRRDAPEPSASPVSVLGLAGVLVAVVVTAGLVRMRMLRHEAATLDELPPLGAVASAERTRASAASASIAATEPAWPTAQPGRAPLLERRSPPPTSTTRPSPTLAMPTPVEEAPHVGPTRIEPSEPDLAAARRSVEITMYTTSWCPRCKEAKAWMATNGVAYTERDIEASDANMADCKKYNPKASIPTTVVDGNVLIGFGDAYFRSAIDHAAHVRWARAR